MYVIGTVSIAMAVGLCLGYLANNAMNFRRDNTAMPISFLKKCIFYIFFYLMFPLGFLMGIQLLALYKFNGDMREAIKIIFSQTALDNVWYPFLGFYFAIVFIVAYLRNYPQNKT